MSYLAITGSGDPDGPSFGEKVGALYAVAFTVKMARKKAGNDYKVAGLEGLWWGVGTTKWMIAQTRDEWRWKLLIRVPDFVTAREVAAAAKALLVKGKGKAIARVKLETLREGRTMDAMLECAKANGLRFTGRHHEIYLSDPRRVRPEKLRTILRHPVR